MSDFSNMDNSNYANSLNEFFTSQSEGQTAFQAAKQAAQGKVQDFNEALQGTLEPIGGTFAAKGIGKLLPRVKSAINDQFNSLKQKAVDKLNEAGDQLKNKIKGEDNTGTETEPTDEPFESPDGIEMQDATNWKGADEDPAELDSEQPEADLLDDTPTDTLGTVGTDEFDPSLMPEGAGGRVQRSEQPEDQVDDSNGPDASQTGNNEASDSVENATNDSAAENATDTSADAVTDGAVEGASEGGLEGVEAGLAASDAAQGGLDVFTDLATLGVGLAMIFGGIFGKKHPKAPPPPPTPINASFQAGVN